MDPLAAAENRTDPTAFVHNYGMQYDSLGAAGVGTAEDRWSHGAAANSYTRLLAAELAAASDLYCFSHACPVGCGGSQ